MLESYGKIAGLNVEKIFKTGKEYNTVLNIDLLHMR
jgi:hypothetical protein